MKKLLALVLVLCLTSMANVGFANYLADIAAFQATDWYQDTVSTVFPLIDPTGSGNSTKAQHGMAQHGIYNDLVWNEKMLNNDFPYNKLRDVKYIYNQYKQMTEVPMNCLGLGPNGGNNLRSSPDYSSNANIIGKIHGNETFYLYFSVINFYNVEWYYVVTASGVEGFLAASRVQTFI